MSWFDLEGFDYRDNSKNAIYVIPMRVYRLDIKMLSAYRFISATAKAYENGRKSIRASEKIQNRMFQIDIQG